MTDQTSAETQAITTMSTTNPPDISGCVDEILSDWNQGYIAPTAICLMFVLSWFERRKNTSQTGLLGGRPGCLMPVNLLDGDRYRLSYAAAFGCTSSSIFNHLVKGIYSHVTGINTQIYSSSNELSEVIFYLMTMVNAVVIGIKYYPLFACLEPRFRFVHSTIGLGYTIVCLVISWMPMKDYIECLPTSAWIVTMTTILLYVPQTLCLFYLAGRFLYMLVTDVMATVRTCRQRNDGLNHVEQVPHCTNRSDRLANSEQIQHVRELFTRTDDPTTTGSDNYISRFIDTIQLSYQGGRAFRYSHRVVVTFTVALICLYQISVLAIGGGSFVISLVPMSQNETDPMYDVVKASFYVSSTLTTVTSGIAILQIMVSYRRNLEALYKGDFSCIPSEARQQSAVAVMINSLHYSGTQIAYLFWSYVIQFIMLFVVCVGVSYLIVLPVLGKAPMDSLQPVLTVITTSAIAFVTNWLQKLVSRKWLFQNHRVTNTDSEWPELVLALDNRKAYHNMAYFVFFYYIFIGVVHCLMKIFKAVFLGVVFLGRIDKRGLMTGFDTWDTGYMAYVSFLQMELVHCHPVLVVFCDLLCQKAPGNIKVPMHGATSSQPETTDSREALLSPTLAVRSYGTTVDRLTTTNPVPKYNRRLHNRWLKVYTLLRNPSLAVKQ